MNLEKNLIDNILECEVKLGQADMAVTFYYPVSSLCELLDCQEEGLAAAIEIFKREETGRLGHVGIEELPKEKGRFGVTIPVEGVRWVHMNFVPSDFMKEFVEEISKRGNKIDDLIDLFHRYSKDVLVQQVGDREWSLCFADDEVDPYVYHIEENAFGLEYHRFTKTAYSRL